MAIAERAVPTAPRLVSGTLLGPSCAIQRPRVAANTASENASSSPFPNDAFTLSLPVCAIGTNTGPASASALQSTTVKNHAESALGTEGSFRTSATAVGGGCSPGTCVDDT